LSKLFFVKRNLGVVLKEIEAVNYNPGSHKVIFNPTISNATLMSLDETLIKIRTLKGKFNIV